MGSAARNPSRRSVVLGSLAVSATVLAGCTSSDRLSTDATGTPAPGKETRKGSRGTRAPRVLLAFFSRAGENYHYGGRTDLEVGNTKVLAGLIADRIDCDLYEIEAAEPYSDDYDATVQRNVEEQDADARPGLAGALPSLDEYDVVLLASPIWNVRPPMIMKTFAEALDFTGKAVHPVVTYAVSGLGTAVRDYTESCPGAMLRAGLAVRGEKVSAAGPDVDDWLTDIGQAVRQP